MSESKASDSTEVAPPASQISRRRSVLVLALSGAILGILLLGIATYCHGKTGFEKTAIRLLTPLGFGWWLLGACFLSALLRRSGRQAVLLGIGWIAMTICTCDPIVSIMTRSLEESVELATLSKDEPLDYVVVLGGGTGLAPGRAQLTSSGDRVLLGAELYFQGYTKNLITTGEAIDSIGGKKRSGPADQTFEIWTKLGIPESAILKLPGINTYLETKGLAEAIESGQLANKRIGLVTSATHLPRAIRLAKSHGIDDLHPIAADYRAKSEPYYTFMDFLPGTKGLSQLYKNQHEYMAKIVGR